MEKLNLIKPIKTGWTFDSIKTHSYIGSIREPLVLESESGKEFIPSSILYKKDKNGDRTSPLLKGRYKKVLFEYAKPNLGAPDTHIILDETSNLQVIGMPFTKDSKIFSSMNIFEELKNKDLPESELFRRLHKFFPDIQFGLLGSWAIQLQTLDSDIDLFVNGGKQFNHIFYQLHQEEVQNILKVYPMTKEALEPYARAYSQQFQISIHEARYLAKLRNRFIAKLNNEKFVKLGFSSTFTREEYQMQTILGSKRIGKISAVGIAVNTQNSTSFPRQYIVSIEGQLFSVLAIGWTLRRLVNQGDTVKVVGTRRTKDGKEFISLEDEGDILLKLK